MVDDTFTDSPVFVEVEGRNYGELLVKTVDGKDYLDFNIKNILQGESIELDAIDVSKLNLGSEEDGEIYLHNGVNAINTDNGQTARSGYYAWDNETSEFKTIVQFGSTGGTPTTGFLITDYTLNNSILTETTLG